MEKEQMEQLNQKVIEIKNELQNVIEKISGIEIELMNDPQDELNDALTSLHSSIAQDIENLDEATEDFQMKINRME